MLVEAIDRHCSTLEILNFSNNKIGDEGALSLSEKIIMMKGLLTLNLDGNALGDDTMSEIIKSVNTLANLKILKLSNNALGNKTNESQFVDQLNTLLKNSGTLIELDLSWNNFRGKAAENLLVGLKENFTIKKLNLSFNLFGVSVPGCPASIVKFSEVLQENTVLEEVDLSNNLIDAKSAFCLAHGLRINITLKSFIINGNPIGSSGIKYLLQSLNDNEKGKVNDIKLKETETIVEHKKNQAFNPMDVERSYALFLDDIYDRVVLYHLLDIDEKLFQNSLEEEEIQQGD
jgi:Ran GTPase-activating protein (RanGAP) involved in mRNA processing and transport